MLAGRLLGRGRSSAEELHELTALAPLGAYLSFDIKPLIELDKSLSMGRARLPD